MLHHIWKLFRPPQEPLTLECQIVDLLREHTHALWAECSCNAATVLTEHPPQLEHAKKKVLFELGLSVRPAGSVTVRRYGEIALPTIYRPFRPDTEVHGKPGFMKYASESKSDHWCLNFAHSDLFNGYGHFMFAQDEIQVAEHPVLASLRELMLKRTDRLRPVTREAERPTPLLFRAVPRVLRIDTRSMYGARFARTDDAQIRDAVQILEPAGTSNILAIEAPVSTGNEFYSRDEIEYALRAAYSGFRAVVLSSAVDCSPIKPVIIHSGNWGCGAYGGSRPLMLTIQIMAARLAGVRQLVLFCGQDRTDEVARFETDLSDQYQLKPGARISNVIQNLTNARFRWGIPDGN